MLICSRCRLDELAQLIGFSERSVMEKITRLGRPVAGILE